MHSTENRRYVYVRCAVCQYTFCVSVSVYVSDLRRNEESFKIIINGFKNSICLLWQQLCAAHKTGDRDIIHLFLPFSSRSLFTAFNDYGISACDSNPNVRCFRLLDSIIIIAHCFTRLLFCFLLLFRCCYCCCACWCWFWFVFHWFLMFCYLKSATFGRFTLEIYQMWYDISLLGKLVTNTHTHTQTGKMNCLVCSELLRL